MAELLAAIIILPAIKAEAAHRLAVTTHVVVLCTPVRVVIGNQAMAALEALTPVPHTDGNLSGVTQGHAFIHLASVAAANTANQDVHVPRQFGCAY